MGKDGGSKIGDPADTVSLMTTGGVRKMSWIELCELD
jgi:hypothetical protein